MAHRRWVWVEDTQTGHRFDVDHRQLDRLVQEEAVTVVEGYPVNEGPNAQPRQAKHATGLDGVARRDRPSTESPATSAGPPASTSPLASASTRRGTRTATATSTANIAEGVE